MGQIRASSILLTPFFVLILAQGEINVWTEVTRALMGRRHHTLPSLAQAFLDKLVVEVRFLRYQRKVFMGREEATWIDLSGDDTTSEAEDSSSSPPSPGTHREIEWKKDVVERKKSPTFLAPPSPGEISRRKDSQERRLSIPFILPQAYPPTTPAEVSWRSHNRERKRSLPLVLSQGPREVTIRKDNHEKKKPVPIVLPQAHRPRGETQWKALQMKIQVQYVFISHFTCAT